MIFDKHAKAIQRRKDIFSTNDIQGIRYPLSKKMYLNLNLTPYYKITSKRTTAINVKQKT